MFILKDKLIEELSQSKVDSSIKYLLLKSKYFSNKYILLNNDH